MHWIVERAKRDEDKDPMLWIATGRSGVDDMAGLISVLEERGISYDVVRKPPLADYLVSMEDDTPLQLKPDKPVFAYGSTTMGLVSELSGWKPGYIDAPEMLEAISHWGEHMLNHDAKVATIGTMVPPHGEFFIRPDTDGKAFAGTVTNHEDFDAWRAKIMDITGWTSLPPETQVLYAPVKTIHAEWRLAIVAGKIAAASQYHLNGRLDKKQGAPREVIAYAQARIAEWQPRRAFVMDIAKVDDGYRIIETNSISSSGFYKMDKEAYVDAIETLLIDVS